MAKEELNVGLKNNDKTGDTLRAGGLKIQSNFTEIYNALALDGSNISGGDVLKTGNYADLNNKPDFSNVAISGDFYDLENRPDIGVFVGAPPNAQGVDGHLAGNLAFDGTKTNFYVCLDDYVTQFVAENNIVVDGTQNGGYTLIITYDAAKHGPLLSAYDEGMKLSINPTVDLNWRPISSIILNGSQIEVNYTGALVSNYDNVKIRVDQPEIWKSIPFSLNYGSDNKVIRTGTPAHSYGQAGDKAGMIASDASYFYYCKADYVNDTTDIWHRIAWTSGSF